MKKRRNLIISLLLIAALALGIGYAGVSDDLFINATANVDPDRASAELSADVQFTGTPTYNDYCFAGIDGTDTTGDTAFLTIGGSTRYELLTPSQSAEATYEIINNYDGAVKVTLVTDLGEDFDTYYTVELDCTAAANIAPGETGTVTVKVTPKATFTEAFDADHTFSIELVAELIGG